MSPIRAEELLGPLGPTFTPEANKGHSRHIRKLILFGGPYHGRELFARTSPHRVYIPVDNHLGEHAYDKTTAETEFEAYYIYHGVIYPALERVSDNTMHATYSHYLKVTEQSACRVSLRDQFRMWNVNPLGLNRNESRELARHIEKMRNSE